MTPRSVWLWVLVCGCSASPAPRRDSAAATAPRIAVLPGDRVIRDVSVVPMSSDGVLAHHTVVVRGDRIVAVAPSAAVAVAVPSTTTVIDGAGKWLMPGLADMHVHTWSEDDQMMFLAAGVTTIRNMWGIPEHLRWRAEIARGERLGPTIVTAGPLIDGDPPDWPGSDVLTSPAEADRLVEQHKAAGYDFIKSVSQLTPEAYEALAAAGKRHGMALAGHVPYAVGLEGALAAQQRSIEHLEGYPAALVRPGVTVPSLDDVRGWLRAVVSGFDRSRLRGLVDRTIAAGSWNCPTLVANEHTPELHDAAALARQEAWLGLVPPAIRAGWTHDYEIQRFTADEANIVRGFYAELAEITAALAAANAPLLVGTDAGVPFVIAGESLHEEIELLVAAGVPRPRVLRAATADAWRYLGHPHEAGIIEVGARADLVLLASDPMAAPLPLVPDGVMVRGRWLPRRELEARLAEVAARRASPADPWNDAPLVDGKPLQQARYDTVLAGTTVGQERLAVTVVDGKRVVVGQIANLSSRVDTSYKLGAAMATVTTTHHARTLEITGKLTAGKLVVTGTDLGGRPVSLSERAPADAVLSVPGIAGSLALVTKLAAMKPGARRTLTSIEIASFPRIAIVSVRHGIVRKPDAAGHRVFAVASTRYGATLTSELVVDDAGVVAQTFGEPVSTSVARRP